MSDSDSDKIVDSCKNEIKVITDFHDSLTKDDGETPSIQKVILESKGQVDELKKTIDEKLDKVQNIEEDIEEGLQTVKDLLNPSATISLIRAYKESKEEYSNFYLWVYIGIFILPLLTIIGWAMLVSFGAITLDNPVYFTIFPLTVISGFGIKQFSSHKKGREHFNHNQRFMETFIGIKEELAKLDGEESKALKLKLFNSMIDIATDKPPLLAKKKIRKIIKFGKIVLYKRKD